MVWLPAWTSLRSPQRVSQRALFRFRVWLDETCVVHYPATHLEAACMCHLQRFGLSFCIGTKTSQLGALSGSRQCCSHVAAPNLARVSWTSHREHDKCRVDRRIPCCFRKSIFCTCNSSCVDFQYLLASYGHLPGQMRGCGLWYRLSDAFNHLYPGFAQQRPNALVMSAPSIRIQGRLADLGQAWYHTILVTCFNKLLVFD